MRVLIESALPLECRGEALGVAELTALRSEHGSVADVVIAGWVAGVGPPVKEALAVLQPWIAAPAPSKIREAIQHYAAGLDSEQLTRLAVALTADALKWHPTRELLADVRYGDADEATIGTAIVKLVDEASNRDTRAVLFDLWEALHPIDPSVRKTLISEIMIPIAGHGQGAYDLVRSRLKLAADPPHGTKQQLVDRLLTAAPDDKRRKQMQSRMEDVGLRKPRRKRLGIF